MRIALHSDLHEEFYPVGEAPLPEQSEVDLVLLAGDNNTGAGLPDMLRRYHLHFNAPVLCVLGNHEYYDAEMVTTEKEITVALSDENDIHFLQKSVFEIANVRILGCTLWSDFLIDGQEGKQDAIKTCRSRIMDYRLIQYRDKQFTPEDSMDLMNDHLKWLRGELAQDYPGKTVVMTHHCPSIYFVQEQYLSSNLKGAFVSNLHRIIEQYPIDLWVCGHVHYNVDVTLGGTRLVSNCRGYPKENIPWDKRCVLTL